MEEWREEGKGRKKRLKKFFFWYSSPQVDPHDKPKYFECQSPLPEYYYQKNGTKHELSADRKKSFRKDLAEIVKSSPFCKQNWVIESSRYWEITEGKRNSCWNMFTCWFFLMLPLRQCFDLLQRNWRGILCPNPEPDITVVINTRTGCPLR